MIIIVCCDIYRTFCIGYYSTIKLLHRLLIVTGHHPILQLQAQVIVTVAYVMHPCILSVAIEYYDKQNFQQSTNLSIILPSCLLLIAAAVILITIVVLIIILSRHKYRKQQGLTIK